MRRKRSYGMDSLMVLHGHVVEEGFYGLFCLVYSLIRYPCSGITDHWEFESFAWDSDWYQQFEPLLNAITCTAIQRSYMTGILLHPTGTPCAMLLLNHVGQADDEPTASRTRVGVPHSHLAQI